MRTRISKFLPEKLKLSSCFVQVGLLFVISISAIFIGLLAFGVSHRLVLLAKNIDPQSGPQLVEGQKSPDVNQETPDTPNRISVPKVEPSLTPWNGVGRVTILLLGLDYRDWSSGIDYSRSDTMILLTLDPLTHSAGILSIPRDMWVAIPGFKHGKINTAYYLGDAYKLPGGGPGLAVKTVEQFLGVPINYYAQIDFGAFVRFIDEIGGVKINVPEPITVDLLGSGSATKKTLQSGVQVLPGEWALAYARARYTEGGDFDRANRQQQVIMAIRDRVLSFDMLPTLIGKADILYQELSSGIHTNLSLEDATKLALLASQVPRENIKQGIIGTKQVVFGTSPDNLSILIPLIDKIQVLRDDIFSTTGVLGSMTPGNQQEMMIAENARVSVQNGSSTPGLEIRTADYLRTLGVNVVDTKDVAQATSQTAIRDNTGKPYTVKYLVGLMDIKPNRFSANMASDNQFDVELILGNDWSNSGQLP